MFVRAMCTMLVLVLAVPLAASAQGIPETTVDALCRKDLHKTLTRLARVTFHELTRCHQARTRGRLPAMTDCNQVASAIAGLRIVREADKLASRAERSCTGTRRPGASPPAALGYDSCPAPCAATPIDGTYAGVAQCLTCLNLNHGEALAAELYGTPTASLDRAAERCQTQVGRSARLYLNTRMQTQHMCQSRLERGLLDASTDCQTYDPNSRIERARRNVERSIGRCAPAALATLTGCGSDASAMVACAAAGVETVADALFDAVFRPLDAAPVPSSTPTEPPSTATPAATDTPEPAATPTPSLTPEPPATDTPAPTATETPSTTPPATLEPTATDTPVPTVTNTPEPTATATTPPTATFTATPTATATATATPMPSCDDGIQNGDETDVDCGGSCPTGCFLDEGCVDDSDCDSNHCMDGGFCGCPARTESITATAAFGCLSNVNWQGGTVTRTRHGACQVRVRRPEGPILTSRAESDGIVNPWQILDYSGYGSCTRTTCASGSCPSNGTYGCPQGNTESWYPTCTQCQAFVTFQASSTVVVSCSAQEPTCSDGHQSPGFGESDVDCGGPCAPCGEGKMCNTDADCGSLNCSDGICVE